MRVYIISNTHMHAHTAQATKSSVTGRKIVTIALVASAMLLSASTGATGVKAQPTPATQSAAILMPTLTSPSVASSAQISNITCSPADVSGRGMKVRGL